MMLPNPYNDKHAKHWKAWVNASGSPETYQRLVIAREVSEAEAHTAIKAYWQQRGIPVKHVSWQWIFVGGSVGQYIAGGVECGDYRYQAQRDLLEQSALELYEALRDCAPDHPLIVTLTAQLTAIAEGDYTQVW
jgi:hypothetical protein